MIRPLDANEASPRGRREGVRRSILDIGVWGDLGRATGPAIANRYVELTMSDYLIPVEDSFVRDVIFS